jgi:hypothetical protein
VVIVAFIDPPYIYFLVEHCKQDPGYCLRSLPATVPPPDPGIS